MSTSKTGKHGHAKANFTATDIFTGKKLEDVIPSTHTTSVPVVRRNEYQLLDISDDGFCSLLTGRRLRLCCCCVERVCVYFLLFRPCASLSFVQQCACCVKNITG